ncbi:MAG: right-handed parallel beta-helix repeat-containing protein, partial [candidate division Zixibacteria bacterium]|nr:right-handed parallel beta-helix repeat-containing protein [candidate division Zixibacteria bacterium]
MGKISFIGIMLGLFFLNLSNVFAATIHVPADQPTIQAGIDAAVNGDTVLVADGTYTGDGNRDISFNGKSIVVQSEAGPETTIIDCQADNTNRHRAFLFNKSESNESILNGFTITNGYAPDFVDFYGYNYGKVGGGIACGQASPTIANCIVNVNQGINGGGLYAMESAPILSNCIFRNNSGDGIYIEGAESDTAQLIATSISNNLGPGISTSHSSVNFVDCMMDSNLAEGVFINNGDNISFNKCSFRGNNKSGIRCFDTYGSLIIDSCLFYANEAGGLLEECEDCRVRAVISNSLFDRNTATYGGGLRWQGDWNRFSCINCTFVNNSASLGSGIYVDYNYYASVKNCLFAFNDGSAPLFFGNEDYSFDTLQCTDIYGNSAGDWIGPLAPYLGINDNMSLDPRFCDTANNNFYLASNSPCAPANNGCGAQIGAYGVGCESIIRTLYVATDGNDSTGDGSAVNPFATIQHAINIAADGDLDCTPETGHKRLGGFGTDWYFDTRKGWCHESETEVQCGAETAGGRA